MPMGIQIIAWGSITAEEARDEWIIESIIAQALRKYITDAVSNG